MSTVNDVPIAAVVPTRDRPAHLRAALAALAAALRPGDELVVVDSASRRPIPADVAVGTTLPVGPARPVVVRCDRPGASRARNAGVAASTAPVVAFVDDDCRVTAGWRTAVDDALTGAADLAAVAGRVVPDRRAGPSVAVELGEERHPITLADDVATYGHAANLVCRREALEAVDGFDERLGAGAPFRAAEDKDLVWRLLRAGWRVDYRPELEVVHVQWRTRAQAVRVRYDYGIGAGALTAKLLRLDRPAGRRTLRTRLGASGAGQLWRAARAGDETGAAAEAARLAGVAVGLGRGLVHPLDGERFEP